MRSWKTKILESWKDLLRKRERRLSILSGSQNRYIANTHLEAKIWRRIHGTHQWLRNTRFQAGTEGFIVVAHDQSLFTSNFQSNILHDGAVSRCRFCNTSTETIDHLISQCAILAQNEYTNRHNRVGQYIHWEICNHYDIETRDKWYEHKPLPVVDTPKATILWDFPIRTDRTIQANRPDIVIKHKQSKTCQFIDMSVPSFCYRV